jgi:CO/xanthine dehydrogenase Mo-binding subunit
VTVWRLAKAPTPRRIGPSGKILVTTGRHPRDKAPRRRWRRSYRTSWVWTLTGSTSLAATMIGPYVIPAIDFQVFWCLTNKVPTSSTRGAGRPQGTFVIERCS